MPRSWDDIVAIVANLRDDDEAVKRRQIDVRDRYNGDYVIPLPDVEGEPTLPITLPNLVADGIETNAMGAASTSPTISVPALDDTKERGVRSREYARIRKRAWYAAWHRSQLEIIRRRCFRQHFGYGAMSMIVVPDFKLGVARIEMRDALTAYPEPRDPADIRRPAYCAYVYGRTAHWLRANHGDNPDVAHLLRHTRYADEMYDLVEWVDEDTVVIGVLGPRSDSVSTWDPATNTFGGGVELNRWPNRAGRAPVVATRRVTLDRIQGAMDAMLGTIDLAQRLMALEVDAMERGIYPTTFVIGDDQTTPRVVSGSWDGRKGDPKILANVRQIGQLRSDPSVFATTITDRLESAVRQSAGVNAMATGLVPGSLRTGRALDSFQGFSVEPRWIEAHQVMGRALTHMNEAVADVETGYFAQRKIVAFSGLPGDKGYVHYTPAEHWESPDNVVTYPLPGADINNMTLAAGQIVGAGIGSRLDGMTMHPAIFDPEASMHQQMVEGIDLALLQGLQQQSAQGALPVIFLATVKQRLQEGFPLEEAIGEADRAAREQQAAQVEPNSPEAQPGLAQPGTGAEAQAIQPPRRDLTAFRELVNAMQATSA